MKIGNKLFKIGYLSSYFKDPVSMVEFDVIFYLDLLDHGFRGFLIPIPFFWL